MSSIISHKIKYSSSLSQISSSTSLFGNTVIFVNLITLRQKSFCIDKLYSDTGVFLFCCFVLT